MFFCYISFDRNRILITVVSFVHGSFFPEKEMAISQEGGVVVSWWLRANRWDKNLLEEEGGGGKATIASVSRIQRRNHIQNQTEGKGVLPAGSVPYHASCRYLANTRIQISNLHTLLPRSFFFFLSWISIFFESRAPNFSSRILLFISSLESLQLSRIKIRE